LVTIRQVADEAGVSAGTVSRALNNRPGVSEETRQRILAVARELGYVLPRRSPFSTSAVTHLGLLNRPMREALPANPFYADVFNGIEQICHDCHINLSFSSLNIANGRLRSLPALISDERVGGIILVGAMPQSVVDAIVASAQLPLVLVDNCFVDRAWDAVMTDNPRGAYLAVQHLIAQGHRHVTLIGGPDHPSIVERRAGYEEALRQYDLTPTVIPCPGLDLPDGEQAAVELLRRAPDTTAIVCSNDSQALGVLRKLRELGYRVPDDFSIVGFDDIQMVKLASPPLTTIRVGRKSLGQLAVHLLLGRVSAPGRPATKAIVSVALVERASVCPPRAHIIRV
jgi:DNA-binding LacI/PurR family transcriptional regulator